MRAVRNGVWGAGQMALAALAAVVVSVIALKAISTVEWPAFPSSNQLHALTTAGQVACLLGLAATGALWRRGHRWLPQIAAPVLLAAFVVVTLGMPLGATKLYLFGISVDQQFRTEYLTRLADSPALRDMTYAGLPPFYPPGWFWLGGRAAALTGTPAWEMYKPWAIVSLSIAVAVAFVLWAAMIRFEYALAVTTATAAVTLAYASPEPYAAIITVLIPPVLVLASFFIGPHPMALVFNGFELGAILLAILIANHVTGEGESNWYEGVQLMAVYAVLAAAFYAA